MWYTRSYVVTLHQTRLNLWLSRKLLHSSQIPLLSTKPSQILFVFQEWVAMTYLLRESHSQNSLYASYWRSGYNSRFALWFLRHHALRREVPTDLHRALPLCRLLLLLASALYLASHRECFQFFIIVEIFRSIDEKIKKTTKNHLKHDG